MDVLPKLTLEQMADLFGDVVVGDLIFILGRLPSERGNDDQYSENDSDDNAADDNDQQNQDEDNEDDTDQGNVDEDDESIMDASYDTANTVFTSKMYAISEIRRNSSGSITNLDLAHLRYSSTVSSDDNHTYQILGENCTHNHPSTCNRSGNACQTAISLGELLQDGAYEFMRYPDGDFVKINDPYVCGGDARRRCIEGCHNGYLTYHEMLLHMIKDYEPLVLMCEQDVDRIMPSLCPVCFGVESVRNQQLLLTALLIGAPPGLDEIVDFLGTLDDRRRQLGYSFRQLDEREWNMRFDDMLSDGNDGYDKDYAEDRRWEEWAEAMDPNGTIHARPTSEATIASLTRKFASQLNVGEDPCCIVCHEGLQMDQMLIELPCGHIDQHEECKSQWLRYKDSCPTCRRRVAAVPKENTLLSNGMNGNVSVASDTSAPTKMDGEDIVMGVD